MALAGILKRASIALASLLTFLALPLATVSHVASKRRRGFAHIVAILVIIIIILVVLIILTI